MIKRIFLLVLVLGWSIGLIAQDTVQTDKNWSVRFSPSFWYIGLKGTIYTPPVPSNLPELEPTYEFDYDFLDIATSIQFALMLSGDMSFKHFNVRYNMMGLILKGKGVTPLDLLIQDLEMRIAYFSGDASLGYTFFYRPKLKIDATLGVKWVYTSVDINSNILGLIPVDLYRSVKWVDPAIGLFVSYKPISKLEFRAAGDVGVWVGDEKTYQVLGEGTYFFKKWFFTSLGYRYWSAELSSEQAVYSGVVSGWYMRIGFEF